MPRFRRSGTNWEGRRWTTTPALNSLLDEIEARYPTGNPSVDGTVASQGHDRNSPTSDHRPHPYTGTGVVRAVDIWVTSAAQGDEITETLRTSRDPRLRYVISRRRLYSSYPTVTRQPWEWGHYSGANPHTHHIHISVLSTRDNDTRPWGLHGPQEEEYMLKTPALVRRLRPVDIDGMVDAGIIKPAAGSTKQQAKNYWRGMLSHPDDAAWDHVREELETASLLKGALS